MHRTAITCSIIVLGSTVQCALCGAWGRISQMRNECNALSQLALARCIVFVCLVCLCNIHKSYTYYKAFFSNIVCGSLRVCDVDHNVHERPERMRNEYRVSVNVNYLSLNRLRQNTSHDRNAQSVLNGRIGSCCPFCLFANTRHCWYT